jgi:hypothetical protein
MSARADPPIHFPAFFKRCISLAFSFSWFVNPAVG